MIDVDSNEVHSEENKTSLDNNKKRVLKTPAQLMALEKFYNGENASLFIFLLALLSFILLKEKVF